MDNLPIIWTGAGGSPVGLTPFGIYDNDTSFITIAPKLADWCCRMLGYPIIDIELTDKQLYACFEDAITEYKGIINEFRTKESVLNMNNILKLSNNYGSDASVGGQVEYYTGSLNVVANVQTYDLGTAFFNAKHPGAQYELKKLYHLSNICQCFILTNTVHYIDKLRNTKKCEQNC